MGEANRRQQARSADTSEVDAAIARASTVAVPSDAPEAPAEDGLVMGWVLIDRKPRGWSWARVLIPMSVVEAHVVGKVEPPNVRPFVAQKIALDMMSDRTLDRRGWDR